MAYSYVMKGAGARFHTKVRAVSGQKGGIAMANMSDMVDVMLRATRDGMSREEIVTAGLSALHRAGYRIVESESRDYAKSAAMELRKAMATRASNPHVAARLATLTQAPASTPSSLAGRRFSASSLAGANLVGEGAGLWSRLIHNFDWRVPAFIAVFALAVAGTFFFLAKIEGLGFGVRSIFEADTKLLQDTRTGPGINWGGGQSRTPQTGTPASPPPPPPAQ